MESQADSFYPITFLVNPYRMCYTILVTASRNFQVFPDILNAKEKMRMRILIVEDEKDLGMSCPKCWNWKDTTRTSPMTGNTD